MAKVEWITGSDNPRVKTIGSLRLRKHREETGLTLVEGTRLMEDLLGAGVTFETLVYAPRFMQAPRGPELCESFARRSLDVLPVSDALFDRLAQTESPQGILATIKAPGTQLSSILEDEAPFILAVDRVQDPGNLGTIIRTAAAAGVTGILLGRGTVELANPKVLRATMGAAFRVGVAVEVDLVSAVEALANRGIKTVVGDPRGDMEYFQADLRPPALVLVGNEAQGPAAELMKIVGLKVRIPMYNNTESLNVAVASALLLYECLRRR